MAEGLFKSIVSGNEKYNNTKVESAGIHAFDGLAASPNAIEAVKEFGVDLSRHKARSLSRELVDSAELILGMTKSHKQYIVEMFPGAQDKVYTLKEFAFLDQPVSHIDQMDIADPYGKPLETYKESASEIFGALKLVYERIDSN